MLKSCIFSLKIFNLYNQCTLRIYQFVKIQDFCLKETKTFKIRTICCFALIFTFNVILSCFCLIKPVKNDGRAYY